MSFSTWKAAASGARSRAKQRDLHLAHHRPAKIKRLAGLLVLACRRAVEDHAHGAAVLGLRDQDHGLAEVRVDQVRLGDSRIALAGSTCGSAGALNNRKSRSHLMRPRYER